MKVHQITPTLYLPALGLLTISAFAITGVVVSSVRDVRIPIERASEAPGDVRNESLSHGLTHGLEWPADIELFPDALLVSTEGRESVEYHAEISVVRGANVGVSWTADIIDDRGNIIHSALTKGAERAAKGSVKVTGPIRAELKDGFYAVRVQAAIAPEDEATTIMESIQYVEVTKGKWRELTDIEWYELSRASIAFEGQGNENEVVIP
jgi:hypothetical protein